jgi:hypothetical protein
MKRWLSLIAVAVLLMLGTTAADQPRSPQQISDEIAGVDSEIAALRGFLPTVQRPDLLIYISGNRIQVGTRQDIADQIARGVLSGEIPKNRAAAVARHYASNNFRTTLLNELNAELVRLERQRTALQSEYTTANFEESRRRNAAARANRNSEPLAGTNAGGTFVQGAGAELAFTVNGFGSRAGWAGNIVRQFPIPIAAPRVQATTNGNLPPGYSLTVFRTGQKGPDGNYAVLCKVSTGNTCSGSGPMMQGDPRYDVSESYVAQVNAPNGAAVMQVQVDVTWKR